MVGKAAAESGRRLKGSRPHEEKQTGLPGTDKLYGFDSGGTETQACSFAIRYPKGDRRAIVCRQEQVTGPETIATVSRR